MFEPLIAKEEPILEAVDLAASTVSCTLEACLVTSPPAFAALAVINNIIIGISFFMNIQTSHCFHIYLLKLLMFTVSIYYM
jgi:hypothetical protein